MKITTQVKAPATDQSQSDSKLDQDAPATSSQPSKPDGVGKAAPQDPLLRLRDQFIRTSAYAAHPTSGEVAAALKDVEKFTNRVTLTASAVSAVPTFLAAYAQDDHKVGNHVGQAALNAGVSFIGSKAGSVIGAEIGEAAGAFVGGAFAGVGAIPGAVLGGIVGGFVGDNVGSKMALDDFGAVENRVNQRHG